MGPLIGMLSVAGWAFLVGVLGYVIVKCRQTSGGAIKNDEPRDSDA